MWPLCPGWDPAPVPAASQLAHLHSPFNAMHIFNIFWKGYCGAQQELTLLETYTPCKESSIMWQRRWEAEIICHWTTDFFPKSQVTKKQRIRLLEAEAPAYFHSSKAAAAFQDWCISMAKSFAWGQSQFLPSMIKEIFCFQAGVNHPSFGTWQCLQTWCLMALSTGVSMHCAWKILRPGIYYPGGGVAKWPTLPPSHVPRSHPFLLGFSWVVWGVRARKGATGATWWLQGMQFKLVLV